MKEKKQSLKSKVTYVKKNWMLYIFFLMPALLLTIIFKYVPMGGLLIAFKDYNVIKGVLGSPWVGLEYFKRFLSSPDFMNYLMNTLKVSIYGLLWGFPVPIILALLLNRIRKEGIKKKIQLLIYAPNFISVIVLCGMVRMFLSPIGPMNKLLGISTNWMTMPAAFRTIYIASGIWQGAGRKYYEYRFRESLCVTDRYELTGIGNSFYICIQNRTFEWRLWLFNSGWSFQLGNQRNIADYSQCGCKEAKRW